MKNDLNKKNLLFYILLLFNLNFIFYINNYSNNEYFKNKNKKQFKSENQKLLLTNYPHQYGNFHNFMQNELMQDFFKYFYLKKQSEYFYLEKIINILLLLENNFVFNNDPLKKQLLLTNYSNELMQKCIEFVDSFNLKYNQKNKFKIIIENLISQNIDSHKVIEDIINNIEKSKSLVKFKKKCKFISSRLKKNPRNNFKPSNINDINELKNLIKNGLNKIKNNENTCLIEFIKKENNFKNG